MLFSSLTFLFYFLPVVVLIHRFLPEKWQNPFLFAASLVFYAWGEIRYVPLFFALLIADYGLGLLLDRTKGPAARRWLLAAGVALDIGALLYYKYSGFLLDNLGLRGRFSVPASLPLGISFFTFQAVGYLIDVFRRRTEAERDIFAFGAFLFLFPQLIAGPIVRYGDLKAALHTHRKPDGDALDRGMALFIAGLASKVLLANQLGALSNELHAVTGDCACQWAHLTAYTLHIYFDFWGYSVMTLGMGRMLGFRFPHNFNHPYAAASITDFWRRWHMTLGGWFRDYVYIPLGGSRKGMARTLLNMLVVWALYAVFCVVAGYAFFTAADLAEALETLTALFSFRSGGSALFWLRENALLLAAAFACCVPAVINAGKRLMGRHRLLRCGCMLGLLLLCLAALAKSSYNPFIYFRF